jgi:hypothetical protein
MPEPAGEHKAKLEFGEVLDFKDFANSTAARSLSGA